MGTGTGISGGRRRAHVVVVGCTKGGTGKSTTAMHLIVNLIRQGFRVGALDLDLQQRTLDRFMENRVAFARREGVALAMPDHIEIPQSAYQSRRAREAEESLGFQTCLDRLGPRCDFIVIDTPGADTYLSRLGHAQADTLITPINDSFIDLDVLAELAPEDYAYVRPSFYSELVWEAKKTKAAATGGSIDWVVLRNRLSSLDSRNRREVGATLEALGQRLGFRVAPGFGERVIYREMFTLGLTLLDLRDDGVGVELTMSHVAARRELRDLLEAVGLVRAEPTTAARA